jgi:hypothetical protein
MRRVFLGLALLASAPLLAGEPAEDPARRLLVEVLARFKTANALDVVAKIDRKMHVQGKDVAMTIELEAHVARPAHGTVDLKSDTFHFGLVGDGETVYVVNHGNKQCQEQGDSFPPFFLMLAPVAAWCDPETEPEFTSVELVKDEATPELRGLKVTGKDGRNETWWMDAQGNLVRAAAEQTIQAGSVTETFQFTRFDAVKDAEVAKYTAKLPEGYVLHDPLAEMNAALLKVGEEVPDVAVTDLDGKVMRLRDLKGKTLLLNFWFFH